MTLGILRTLRELPLRTIVGLAIVLCAATWIGLVLFRTHMIGRQVVNCVEIRSLRQRVEEYREAEGKYPLSLSEISASQNHGNVDEWGNPVIYARTDDGYLLVSLGRDGRADGLDWAVMRAQRVEIVNESDDVDADVLLSDRGEHTRCGK